MKKALTIAMAGAALAATVSFVIAGGAKREPAIEADALPGYDIVAVPRYERGPLIIHVPQAGYERGPRIIHVPQADDERADDRASVNERDQPAATNDEETEQAPLSPKLPRAAPQPRKEVAPKPRREITAKPRNEVTPKLKPQRRSDAPPPPPPPLVQPRTVLSAPPPPAEGLSQIRPMSHYKTNADSGEKFEPLRDPVDAAQPEPAQPDSDSR